MQSKNHVSEIMRKRNAQHQKGRTLKRSKMNSEAVEHHNLFNVEQMNKMISDGEASPGIPFTVHYGTGTISAGMK